MKLHALAWSVAVLAASLVAGCMHQSQQVASPGNETLTARYTPTPVRIDGELDDACWQTAESYSLGLKRTEPGPLAQAGNARFAWDDSFLYVAIDFEDLDITAHGETNQLHHYKLGDLAEVFIKPENDPGYWELYVTPHGKKTTFYFPSRGYLFLAPVVEGYHCDLQVAAKVRGTLNNWRDRDQGWTAEMAVPLAAFKEQGLEFAPGTAWRILVARYNYCRYLDSIEYSTTPRLRVGKRGFHALEEYGVLKIEK